MIRCDSMPFILILSALLAVILASHAVSAFCSARLRRIALPIGIAMHLATLVLFMFAKTAKGKAIELDVVVLFFIASTLVYTALSFIARKLAERRAKESEVETSDL